MSDLKVNGETGLPELPDPTWWWEVLPRDARDMRTVQTHNYKSSLNEKDVAEYIVRIMRPAVKTTLQPRYSWWPWFPLDSVDTLVEEQVWQGYVTEKKVAHDYYTSYSRSGGRVDYVNTFNEKTIFESAARCLVAYQTYKLREDQRASADKYRQSLLGKYPPNSLSSTREEDSK